MISAGKSIEPSFQVGPYVRKSEAALERPQAAAYLLLVDRVPVGVIEAKEDGAVRQPIALMHTEKMFKLKFS